MHVYQIQFIVELLHLVHGADAPYGRHGLLY